MVGEVGLRAEEADLDEGARDEAFRIVVKEQDGGPLEVGTLGHLELLQKAAVVLVQHPLLHASAGGGQPAKFGDGLLREVFGCDAGHRHAVPGAALPTQEKAVQRGTLEFLQSAAAAPIIAALVADRVRVGLDHDLQILLAGGSAQVDLDENTQQVAHLVGNVFQQFCCIPETDHFAPVVPPDVQHPALRIGEARDPFQVLVTPGLLVFGVLGFGHEGCASLILQILR